MGEAESSFYDRKEATHLDGTPIFRNADDEKNEQTIADLLSTAWKCNVTSFGILSPIDWFAERDGRVIGLLELKSRTHDTAKHETVFLNVRKWLALSLGAIGMNVPSIYVVRFTDAVRWIEIASVDARNVKMGGCAKFWNSRSNIEPIIHVPVADMHEVIAIK